MVFHDRLVRADLNLRALTSGKRIKPALEDITVARIAREVTGISELTRGDIRLDVPFTHQVVDLVLPARKVTREEAYQLKSRG